MMKRQNKDGMIGYTFSPRLELCGNTECVVDGIRSILEYDRDSISIDLGKYCVTISGYDLRIDSFSPQGAILCGNIVSLEFGDVG